MVLVDFTHESVMSKFVVLFKLEESYDDGPS